jgi:hypothetical protein
MSPHDVKGLIEEQRALMNAVAVRAKEIDDVQDEYKNRRRTIASELRRFGLDDPNPFADLWEWYHHWKENFPTWAERRRYVASIYRDLEDALDHLGSRRLGAGLHGLETGWERVDRQLAQLRERYATARTEEDFQAIGLLCRDLLLSCADACYDHERHGGGKGKPPSSGMDRLEKMISAEAAGGPNKQLRQLLKATMELANNVQHDRTGTLDKAAVAAEATVTAVTLMRIVVEGAPHIDDAESAGEDEDETGVEPGPEPEPPEDWDIPF